MDRSKKGKGTAQHAVGFGSSPRSQDEPPLSPGQAFVVQFREGVGREPQYFAGRVEHVVTGEAARFHSKEELTTFMARVLAHAGVEPARKSRNEV